MKQLRRGSALPSMPAQMKQESTQERRYDPVVLQKVTALAERLQSRQHETLTAREIESIGAEVGLAPAFVRQALTLLTAEPPPVPLKEGVKRRFWTRAAPWAIPPLWAFIF